MFMAKKPMTYYTSDTHFTHVSKNPNRGILAFERENKFNTIQEHDEFLVGCFEHWAERWAAGSTLWFLGDFGNPNYLWVFNILRSAGMTVLFMKGNHEKAEDTPAILAHVDEAYDYPVYLSQKLVVSHYPVPTNWGERPDQQASIVNVHGHLHGAKLADLNHINASIHICDYQPISQKYLDTIFARLPKFDRRFLYEPWAADYVFTQPKEDCVYDRDGRIDLSASRLLQKLKKEKNNG